MSALRQQACAVTHCHARSSRTRSFLNKGVAGLVLHPNKLLNAQASVLQDTHETAIGCLIEVANEQAHLAVVVAGGDDPGRWTHANAARRGRKQLQRFLNVRRSQFLCNCVVQVRIGHAEACALDLEVHRHDTGLSFWKLVRQIGNMNDFHIVDVHPAAIEKRCLVLVRACRHHVPVCII